MGYYVRALSRKKKPPAWKVQFVVYKPENENQPAVPGRKRTWDIAKERWRSLGFHPTMTIEDVKARSRQLNAQLQLKRQEECIRKIEKAEKSFRLKNDSVLPVEFVEEFETWFIRAREQEKLQRSRRIKRLRVVWKAAQKMILAIGIEPSEWFYHVPEIYDYFYHRQLSISYVKSILKTANLWGYFISRKLAKPFLAVPPPRGYERLRILDAFYLNNKNKRKPSAPITPGLLALKSGKINRSNFNWLFLSVWLGLRPQEVDNLHDSDFWTIEKLVCGKKLLRVYQTKIVALPPEDRWKPIPILYDEQEFALKIIMDGNFKRPIHKTMRSHFGSGFDLYGGRKGFTDLMLSRGHSLENISVWMGHSSIGRTWRSYKDKKVFQL